MTYNADVSQQEAPLVVELFHFQVGTRENFYVGGHNKQIEFNGSTWLPRPIKRNNFKNAAQVQPDRIKITAPLDPITLAFVANAPVEDVLVDVTSLVPSTGNSSRIFTGRVMAITLKGFTAEADCEGNTEVFRQQFPKFTYQSSCQWMVFDGGCQLLEQNFQTDALITLQSNGSVLRSATFATQPDGFFTMGHVRHNTDIRLITDHVGQDITLQVPFDSRLQDGQLVSAFPGCDKTFETCRDKFNNLARRTGFDLIPETNPAVWKIK